MANNSDRQNATVTPPNSQYTQLLERYGDAWARHSLDEVVALHSEDGIFQLFMQGAEQARGRAAIKSQFQQVLVDNPGYRSTSRSTSFGQDFVVLEYDIHMDKHDFLAGNYVVPAIDLIQFKDGLIWVKHTYLDRGFSAAHSRSTTL
jgi:hypothetical protein